MSIILPQNSKIKPAMWMCDPGIVAYNCARLGLPVPVLAMPLWEGAGNKAFDYSGRKDNGDISGSTWQNQGLYFDGTGDWIAVPDYDDITNQVSVFVVASRGNIVHYNHLFSRHPGWFISANTGTLVIQFGIDTGSTVGVAFDTFANIPENTTSSYCGVYNGATVKTYLNGIYKNQANQTGNISLAGFTRIGRYHGDTSYNWIGAVRLALLFKVALSDTQQQILYNNLYSMFEPVRSPAIWSIPAVGVAPTSVFYGPLSGPTAGLI